jgi:hypothetical protein
MANIPFLACVLIFLSGNFCLLVAGGLGAVEEQSEEQVEVQVQQMKMQRSRGARIERKRCRKRDAEVKVDRLRSAEVQM